MNKLFDYKRRYIASDGEEYINMGIPALDLSTIQISTILSLNQDNNGRLDNFTYNIMKDIDSVDTLMYINHIYNPFAVQDGDILYIPNGGNHIVTEEPVLIDGTTLSKKEEKTKTYAEKIKALHNMLK